MCSPFSLRCLCLHLRFRRDATGSHCCPGHGSSPITSQHTDQQSIGASHCCARQADTSGAKYFVLGAGKPVTAPLLRSAAGAAQEGKNIAAPPHPALHREPRGCEWLPFKAEGEEAANGLRRSRSRSPGGEKKLRADQQRFHAALSQLLRSQLQSGETRSCDLTGRRAARAARAALLPSPLGGCWRRGAPCCPALRARERARARPRSLPPSFL